MDDGASSYRRFLDGDESGFDDIVKIYSKSLLYFINSIVCSLSIAEDLMEDTFVDLIVYKSRFKARSSLKTFLFSIARNKAVDYIRKNRKQVNIDDLNDQLNDLTQLENIVIKTETQREVAKALDSIKCEYKTILVLIYFENMSYEEASLVLKKTSKQVKNLAYSARKALKSILEQEGFIYEEP